MSTQIIYNRAKYKNRETIFSQNLLQLISEEHEVVSNHTNICFDITNKLVSIFSQQCEWEPYSNNTMGNKFLKTIKKEGSIPTLRILIAIFWIAALIFAWWVPKLLFILYLVSLSIKIHAPQYATIQWIKYNIIFSNGNCKINYIRNGYRIKHMV